APRAPVPYPTRFRSPTEAVAFERRVRCGAAVDLCDAVLAHAFDRVRRQDDAIAAAPAAQVHEQQLAVLLDGDVRARLDARVVGVDRKSTRLNSSHVK